MSGVKCEATAVVPAQTFRSAVRAELCYNSATYYTVSAAGHAMSVPWLRRDIDYKENHS